MGEQYTRDLISVLNALKYLGNYTFLEISCSCLVQTPWIDGPSQQHYLPHLGLNFSRSIVRSSLRSSQNFPIYPRIPFNFTTMADRDILSIRIFEFDGPNFEPFDIEIIRNSRVQDLQAKIYTAFKSRFSSFGFGELILWKVCREFRSLSSSNSSPTNTLNFNLAQPIHPCRKIRRDSSKELWWHRQNSYPNEENIRTGKILRIVSSRGPRTSHSPETTTTSTKIELR
jgi:hypothetical protein